MNKFARDIQLTLCIKLVLLLGLWFFVLKARSKTQQALSSGCSGCLHYLQLRCP